MPNPIAVATKDSAAAGPSFRHAAATALTTYLRRRQSTIDRPWNGYLVAGLNGFSNCMRKMFLANAPVC